MTTRTLLARAVMVCLLFAGVHESTAASKPSPGQALAAMKKAAQFMIDKVAVNGGYVWVVSDDLTQRWGEVPARPSQVWLQGGTERVGEAFLDAYEVTHDAYYLDGARKAADALVFGQHHLGGWHYFVDFDPKGLPEWYRTSASRFHWGLEEYRHYYGNATFDDQVTADAAAFLLRFYRTSLEAAYHEPALKGLDFILMAQYPNGAWPQRFPLSADYPHDGLPDYTSFYTLNDGAAQSNIEVLLTAYDTLGDQRYWDGAKKGVEALMLLQGPEDQGCWAEQHGFDLRPIAARTHEPAGYVVRESIGVISLLQQFYLRTGDKRYLTPIPRCLAWLERINRESAAERYPVPRYWEPGTNRPLYVVRTSELTTEGYGKYKWTTKPSETLCDDKPCMGEGKQIVDVSGLRSRYEAIAALDTPAVRAARLPKTFRRGAPPANNDRVAEVIASLDKRGAWVTDDNSVPIAGTDTKPDTRENIRGISTQTFVRNFSILMGYVRQSPVASR